MNDKEFSKWMLAARAWRKSIDNLFQANDAASTERKRQWKQALQDVPFDTGMQFIDAIRLGDSASPENYETSELPKFVRSFWRQTLHRQTMQQDMDRYKFESKDAWSILESHSGMRAALEHIRKRLVEHQRENELAQLPVVDDVPGLRAELKEMV